MLTEVNRWSGPARRWIRLLGDEFDALPTQDWSRTIVSTRIDHVKSKAG